MDGLLSKDWTLEDFYKRAIYIEPSEVLKNPKDMKYLFERYRKENDMIDFLGFYDKVITEERVRKINSKPVFFSDKNG